MVLQSFQPIAIPPERNAKPVKYSLLISWYIPNNTNANETTNEVITKNLTNFNFFIFKYNKRTPNLLKRIRSSRTWGKWYAYGLVNNESQKRAIPKSANR